MKFFYSSSRGAGFTLIETLITLFILSVTLVGALGVVTLNLATAHSIKNSFVASGLSQEGMEIVRNLRDNDWFADRPFGAFGSTTGNPVPNGVYRVQYNSTSLLPIDTNPFLLKDSNGIYRYTGGTTTPFQRSVTLTKVSPQEIKIVVEVTWQDRTILKKVSAEGHLYNWL